VTVGGGGGQTSKGNNSQFGSLTSVEGGGSVGITGGRNAGFGLGTPANTTINGTNAYSSFPPVTALGYSGYIGGGGGAGAGGGSAENPGGLGGGGKGSSFYGTLGPPTSGATNTGSGGGGAGSGNGGNTGAGGGSGIIIMRYSKSAIVHA
jgi:hypothetical protein